MPKCRLGSPSERTVNTDNENYSDYIEDASGHGGDLYQSESAVARNYRYTLDRSTPTGGPSGQGTKIASGKVTFPIGHKTLKAIAYKAGWTTSLIAVGAYDYEPGGGQ